MSPRSIQALRTLAGIFANVPPHSGQGLSLSDFFFYITAGNSRWVFKDHRGMGSGGSGPGVTPRGPYREDGTRSLRNARSGIQGGATLSG